MLSLWVIGDRNTKIYVFWLWPGVGTSGGLVQSVLGQFFSDEVKKKQEKAVAVAVWETDAVLSPASQFPQWVRPSLRAGLQSLDFEPAERLQLRASL